MPVDDHLQFFVFNKLKISYFSPVVIKGVVACIALTIAGNELCSCFRFAQALEVIPRVLAENSGVKPKEVISKLYAAHTEGNKNIGFDIEGESGDVKVGGPPVIRSK